MVYRITTRSNPRLLLLRAASITVPAAAVAILFLLHPLAGVLAILAGAWLAYAVHKFMAGILKSEVETLTDGIRIVMLHEQPVYIPWDEIDYLGRFRQDDRREALCIYKESGDRLITIPDEFEGFECLAAELAEHGSIAAVELAPGETITDRLRNLFGTETER
jgi:hypothetical protein